MFVGKDIWRKYFPACPKLVEYLAQLAIKSVPLADEGRDGITYLRDAISAGIRTPLTEEYRDEVLRLTGADTLDEAIIAVRGT